MSLLTQAKPRAEKNEQVGRRRTASSRGKLRSVRMTGIAALFLLLVFLYVVPIVMLLIGAFRTSAPGLPGQWSTSAFPEAYRDPDTYSTLSNSVVYAISVTVLAMAGGIFFAWVATRTNMPGRRFITPIMVLVEAIPFLLFVLSWSMLGNARVGLLNQLLRTVWPTDEGPFNVLSWTGLITVTALKSTALMYLLMRGAFGVYDRYLQDASLVAGAGRVRTFFMIEIPLLAPALLGIFILASVRALESFEVPLILGRPAGIYVFSTQIYDYVTNAFPPNYAGASALSILVLVLVALLVLTMWKLIGRRDFATVTGKGPRAEPVDIGKWKWPCLFITAIYVILAVIAPLAEIVLGSLQPVYGLFSNGFTGENYGEVLSKPQVSSALWTSLLLALVVGFVAACLSTMIAYIIQRTSSRGIRGFLEGVTWLPWATPGVVLGLGILWAYLSLPVLRPLYGTKWLVMIGLVVVVTPITVRLGNAAIAQVSSELEEAAEVHGASRARAIAGILVRLILPTFVIGWFLAGLLAAGNLSIPILLAGPNSETVPGMVLQLYDEGHPEQAAALFSLLIGIICAGGLLILAVREGLRHYILSSGSAGGIGRRQRQVSG